MGQEEKKVKRLYVTSEHPYYEDVKNIKISANPEFTSPVINVFEEKNAKHDIETGKNLGRSLHGMYYDTKNGKFIKKWVNDGLLKSISNAIEDDVFLKLITFPEEIKLKDINEIFVKKYLNKKVTLHSVNIELNKKKINRSNSTGKLVETNHLDFLPPIMHVIGYRFIDEKKKYCDESGRLNIEFKCKWYNHVTKSFSEEFIHYQILCLIIPIDNEQLSITRINDTINSNKLFQYPINEGFKLEGLDIFINHTIIEPKEIVYKHYFHNLNSFDFVSQQEFTANHINNLVQIDDNVVWGNFYPSYLNNIKKNISDCSFEKGKYLEIKYKDQFERITKRIIRVSELLIYGKNSYQYEGTSINLNDDGFAVINNEEWKNPLKTTLLEDEDITIMIKANCLLRKGMVRYFRFEGILNIKEIKNFDIITKTGSGDQITYHSLFEEKYNMKEKL